MYFWRIRALKEQLKARATTERSAFLYLLVAGVLASLGAVAPPYELNNWDFIERSIAVVAFILGTVWCYRSNGGINGSDFVVRYLSLLWVFGIRFTVAITIPVIVAVLLLEEALMPGGLPDQTSPIEVLVTIALSVVFYWLLARHLGEVAGDA